MKKISPAELARQQLVETMANNNTSIPAPEEKTAPEGAGEGMRQHSSSRTTGREESTGREKISGRQGEGYKATLISLYPNDVDKIQEIIKFVVNRGRKANASTAVRLALRSVALTDSLLDYEQEMQLDDMRRKGRHLKNR